MTSIEEKSSGLGATIVDMTLKIDGDPEDGEVVEWVRQVLGDIA